MEPYRQSVAPEHGPRIAAIGGGTGLSTLLRGLKRYTKNITAIVTVADDGGGSGRLRQDLGMLPPGDIRNCLEALANAEPLMAQLMHYRFPEGELAGQSFGNLFLAALNGIMPSFDRAVESLSQVLAITGRVLPVTNENIQLEAEFENGARVVGESRIFQCKQEPSQGPAGGGGGHPGGGDGGAGAGEPVYQHHPQSAGGWYRGGHPGVPCPENLRL